MSIQPAFGTKDLNPQEVQKNQQLISTLSNLYTLWGYEEVSPPKVERLETLTAAGGIANKELFISTAIKGMKTIDFKKYPLSGSLFKVKTNIKGKKNLTFRTKRLSF